MKAIILAAGKGTRMGALTEELPKPMLPVEDKPILEHIISGIAAQGVRKVCLIVGWKGEVIREHFGDGSALGLNITYTTQEVQDGTGKAPELARNFVGNDPFLLTYGDILVRPETYAQMIARFGEANFSGLITVTPGEDVRKGGINFFDDAFCLKKIVEKPSDAQLEQLRAEGWLKEGEPVWYNAGIYIFNPVLFDHTARLQKSPRGEYELTDAIETMIDANETIAGAKIKGRWVDVRNPEVLKSLG
ncbi:MAG: nucleotidyltransferase family protein [Verrucomicrobiota bacterium]|nr:nucleotidyltransferase family protein [Verrucomicrobiota bacterium]